MSRSILLRLTLGLLAALAPAGLAAQQPAPDAVELVAVEFDGASAFAKDSLALSVVNRPTGCRIPVVCWFGVARDRHYLQPAELQADAVRLRLYYYERGYRAARVEPEVIPAEGGARLRFRIHEGEPVRVRAITLPGMPAGLEPLAKRLPIQVGDPLSLIAQEAVRDSLRSMLRERGFAHAEVLSGYSIRSDAPTAAVLDYQVYPGPRAHFGAIRVVGAERVDSAVVRRMLSFRPGDPYRDSELLLSQRNLFGVEIFRHAQIVMDSAAVTSDSIVPVVVQVNEGDTHRLRFGAGVNTEECANAEGRWTHRNFLGGARRFEFRARIANVLADRVQDFPCSNTGSGVYGDLTGSAAAEFSQPAFVGSGTHLGAGVYVERRSVPGVFVRSSRGAYLNLTRAPGARSSSTFGFRPELTELDADDEEVFCTSLLIACEAEDIQVLSEPHWLAPVTASFARDRSNALFAPTAGYILRLDAEYASRATGSDFAYARILGELSAYRGLGGGVVLASRFRPGWARATGAEGGGLGLHPQKRFFAGGPNSLRGFAQYRLGPKVLSIDPARLTAPTDSGGAGCSVAQVNAGTCDAEPVSDGAFDVHPVGGSVLLEGSLELRFPLVLERLRGAAFVDVGQVWRSADEVHMEDVVFTPGVGVRYFSPAGPIRVDVGYNAQRSETLPVLTTGFDRTGGIGETHWVEVGRLRPLEQPVAWDPRGSFLERLQVHFSIGQAF